MVISCTCVVSHRTCLFLHFATILLHIPKNFYLHQHLRDKANVVGQSIWKGTSVSRLWKCAFLFNFTLHGAVVVQVVVKDTVDALLSRVLHSKAFGVGVFVAFHA